jgi:hypothetical protein
MYSPYQDTLAQHGPLLQRGQLLFRHFYHFCSSSLPSLISAAPVADLPPLQLLGEPAPPGCLAVTL